MPSQDASRLLNLLLADFRRGRLDAAKVIDLLRRSPQGYGIPELLSRLPEDLLGAYQASLVENPPLKGVGYWHSPESPRFPSPKGLVCEDWCTADRDRIVRYLRSGWTYASWRGLSHCRFRCGERHMGSRCLTDGEWVWPEGLPHYVEVHHVRLPDEMIASMRAREWLVPAGRDRPSHDTAGEPDCSFWIAWAERANKGWLRRLIGK